MPQRRHILQLAAGALVAPLAAPAISRAAEQKTLRFVPQADLAILDPIATPAFVTRAHGFMVFDTLYGVDEHFVAQPQMVEGHAVEQDGKLWRLTLREGLRFHDNEPVRARDVVASLNRWGKRDTYGFDLMAVLDELSAGSDREVVFRLKKPFPTLPDLLGKAGTNMPCIMPERLAATDPMRPVTEMIGSGPFRFLAAERVPGARAVYERFAGYVPRPNGVASMLAGPKRVHLDRVEWRTMPDPATAAAALQAGEVDWWEQPLPDLLPILRRSRAIRTEILDEAGFVAMLRLNHVQPPFDNPGVRRAILAALSQADVMRAVAGEDRAGWRDGIGFLTPGPLASDAGMAPLLAPRSIDEAKRQLQAAGYKGEKVVLMAPTDFASINMMSQVIGDLFKQMGFNLDYQASDWGTVAQRWNSRQPVSQGGWSAFCTFTTAASTMTPADNKFIRGIGERGLFGWPDSAEIETHRSAFLDAVDPVRQQAACRAVQEAAFRDLPYLPLGVFFQPTAFRSSLSDIPKGFPVFFNVRKT
ncbi:MAG: transporter substrate-binding protein [Belnapia sp.]|nr:transporter substrate-binding protein [Belnapia sp.]